MDLTHLHLILNHIPVIGIIIGFLILAWGALRGYDEVNEHRVGCSGPYRFGRYTSLSNR